MKTTKELQLVPIDRLIPYVNNVRTHSAEQINKLRSSLREFGFVNPVIIDRDYNVIAGHGRIMAAKAENITEVPCVFVDYLTDAQKKAYILADNRMALDADWDEKLLKVEIESLQGADFDLNLTGFDEAELMDIFGDDNQSRAKDDDFDLTAALEKASFVEKGDVWTVGRHRLMCGDATSSEDVSALMGSTKANLILTDPPYGVSFKSSSGLTIQNDSIESFINMKIMNVFSFYFCTNTVFNIFNKNFWIWYYRNCISIWKMLSNSLLFVLRKINHYLSVVIFFAIFFIHSKHTEYWHFFCWFNSN